MSFHAIQNGNNQAMIIGSTSSATSGSTYSSSGRRVVITATPSTLSPLMETPRVASPTAFASQSVGLL